MNRWSFVPLILLAVVGAGGCSTVVIPPEHPLHPQPVFVANYGRHSSLLLPTDDGGMTEYAFGDWDWFAENKEQFSDAFAALFWSPSATLGRRHLMVSPRQSDVAEVVGAQKLVKVDVSAERIVALLESLDARFHEHAETLVYNHVNEFVFVKDDERYGLCNNCNHATAHWLRDLGCQTHGLGLTADFQVHEKKRDG